MKLQTFCAGLAQDLVHVHPGKVCRRSHIFIKQDIGQLYRLPGLRSQNVFDRSRVTTAIRQ
eukprot:4625019-Karenia_brevis.AAC.1